MAFTVKNSGGANWADFKERTNPLATPANVMKAKLDRLCCDGGRIDIDLTYQVNNAGDDIDFTQNTAISGLRFYTIYVTDGQGNEAVGAIDVAATTTPINIDTSALDASQPYKVEAKLSNAVPAIECECDSCYGFTIGSPSTNPTDTIDTAQVVGALAVSVEATGLAKVAVASGGSQAIPAATVGDVVDVALYLSNATASSLLTATSVAVSGDGSFSAVGFTPLTLDDSLENNQWVVRMDTASAGAKSATVTIVSDDAASPYTVTLTLTVA